MRLSMSFLLWVFLVLPIPSAIVTHNYGGLMGVLSYIGFILLSVFLVDWLDEKQKRKEKNK